MDRFTITQQVAEQLPEMLVVVITAKGINNSAPNEKVQIFANEIAYTTLSTLLTLPNAQSHPRIDHYRTTLKTTCAISPKKHPQSNESLYKRLLKVQAPLPSINPLVDFYNAISIAHGVTAGAFDLAALKRLGGDNDNDNDGDSPLELRLAGGTEMFDGLGAREGEAVRVGRGEVVYAMGEVVLTRQLAWRQAVQGLVGEGTRDVVFVSEVLCEGGRAERKKLAEEVERSFREGVRGCFGVEATVEVLGAGIGKLSLQI